MFLDHLRSQFTFGKIPGATLNIGVAKSIFTAKKDLLNIQDTVLTNVFTRSENKANIKFNGRAYFHTLCL